MVVKGGRIWVLPAGRRRYSIGRTPEARRQARMLAAAYARLERPEAVRNPVIAVAEAARMIERNPAAGLPAPRLYPEPARLGKAWVKVGRYWVRCSLTPAVITGVYH